MKHKYIKRVIYHIKILIKTHYSTTVNRTALATHLNEANDIMVLYLLDNFEQMKQNEFKTHSF